jgi:hypothetical protein
MTALYHDAQRRLQVERSKFVPRKTGPPPVPDWKRSDWACDVLPEGDPARQPRRA